MKASRTLATAVDFAEQRLNDLLALEAREATVARIAAASACAPSTLCSRATSSSSAATPSKMPMEA